MKQAFKVNPKQISQMVQALESAQQQCAVLGALLTCIVKGAEDSEMTLIAEKFDAELARSGNGEYVHIEKQEDTYLLTIKEKSKIVRPEKKLIVPA